MRNKNLGQCAGCVDDFKVDDSYGLNLLAGYRFDSHLAAEAQFEWASGFDTQVIQTAPTRDENAGDIDIASYTFTVNGKAYLLTGRYQPFALVGAGIMTAKVKTKDTRNLNLNGTDTQTGFAARFGGGIDLYATDNIVVTGGIGYVLPMGDVKNLDYVSFNLGAMYRF
jgi:opacity protein-like surface antigen